MKAVKVTKCAHCGNEKFHRILVNHSDGGNIGLPAELKVCQKCGIVHVDLSKIVMVNGGTRLG